MDIQALLKSAERFRSQIAIGAVLLVVICGGVLWLVFSGRTRIGGLEASATSTIQLPPETPMRERLLDGIMVPAGTDNLAPRAVMVENHPDARPLSGLSKANIVIESPVEGGITRCMALFAASTTVSEVGPVRSARPYFVEWADGWNAGYFHVGGSPDALNEISTTHGFTDVNQFFNGDFFWRDDARLAPHNVYTKDSLMDDVLARKNAATSTMTSVWHFQDAVTSTSRGDVLKISVPYGGSFNVTWNYDKDRGVYVRSEGGAVQNDRDGSPVEVQNVVVLKTDSQILDSYGRLKLRTTGGGQAIAYRDGNKYPLRWSRAPGEQIRIESNDGTEFIFDRGQTWIEVTTNDLVFAGVSK